MKKSVKDSTFMGFFPPTYKLLKRQYVLKNSFINEYKKLILSKLISIFSLQGIFNNLKKEFFIQLRM